MVSCVTSCPVSTYRQLIILLVLYCNQINGASIDKEVRALHLEIAVANNVHCLTSLAPIFPSSNQITPPDITILEMGAL